MTLQSGDKAIDAALLDALRRLATRGPGEGGLVNSKRMIRESSFHDFSSYQFLFDPAFQFYPHEPDPGITPPNYDEEIPVDIWLEFDKFVRQFRTLVEGEIVDTILGMEDTVIEDLSDNYGIVYQTVQTMETVVRPIAVDGSEAFRTGLAPQLFQAYTATVEEDRFLADAVELVSSWIDETLGGMRHENGSVDLSEIRRFSNPAFWNTGAAIILAALNAQEYEPVADDLRDRTETEREFGSVLPSSFPFDPFLAGSVNVGMQVVYRQGWTPLGTQPGEIVRTLPLGPKQSEKVTVKAIRRTKATRQSEVSTSIETATESSAATKDSSEVVQEASESFNWHFEASASASFGFGSASVTAGMGGENASLSRDTKASLNETMEKTASRIRRDTKIVVSTETEETSEFSQVSEIVNPNDQIAVTYVYSRLQRQYELHTYLSEANMCVFVAEPVTAPHDIVGAWVRRYDWILARELLDEGFRNDLAVVKNYTGPEEETLGMDANIRRLMETYSGEGAAGIPDYSGVPGTIPDMFRTPQQAYEREVERQRARQADSFQYFRSLRRLRAHIFDNILHYCRAIWSAEDPDARLMRYRNIRVPRRYQAVPTGPVGDGSAPVIVSPVVTDELRDTVPLSEIINPAGPIGFAGNYSVFYLRESTRWQSLIDLLDVMMAPYRPFNVAVTAEPADADFGVDVTPSPYRNGGGTYRFVRSDDPAAPLTVFRQATGALVLVDPGDVSFDGTDTFRFHALRVRVAGIDAMEPGNAFAVRLTILPRLEDPELKSIRWSDEPLSDAAAAEFFVPEVIAEMREYFAGIQRVLKDVATDAMWDDLDADQKQSLRDYYFHYVLRCRYTRRIVVDTNNVLLTREVDDATTLEPYKEVHRLLDALKAVEDTRQQQIESDRRKRRLDTDALGDPKIDRLTVVAAARDLADLAPLDGLDNDRGEPVDDGDDGDDG